MKEQFFIVGIGASAGGLEAIKEFCSNLRGKPNAAFVIMQHLSKGYKSALKNILSGITNLPIDFIKDGKVIKPNFIYVFEESSKLEVINGKFKLTERLVAEKINKEIDNFFISLSKYAKEKAIGIILSGAGSDGLEGMKAISERGGISMVQKPATAKFKTMPESVIIHDHPHIILEPKDMPGEIEKRVNDTEMKKDLVRK